MGLWVVWQQVRQPSLGPPPTTAQNRFRSARGWHGSSSRLATTRRPGVDVVGKQLDREVAFEFSFGLTRSALRFRSFLKLASRQVGPARHGVEPKTCFQGMRCNKPNIFRWGGARFSQSGVVRGRRRGAVPSEREEGIRHQAGRRACEYVATNELRRNKAASSYPAICSLIPQFSLSPLRFDRGL